MTRNVRRLVFIPVLAAILSVATLTAPETIPPANAAEPALVFAALNALTQQHVANPNPVSLLDAAVDGLRQALFRTGIAVQLANITGADGGLARREFQRRFDQALAIGARPLGRNAETVLQYFAAIAMIASLNDSHTWFATPEQWEQTRRRQRGEPSYFGIGARLLHLDGRFYAVEVYPNSPAIQAGLRAFDRVLALDGRALAGLTPQDVAVRILSTRGNTVNVTVQRPGQPDPMTASVRHLQFVIPTIDHTTLEGSVGYIKFRQFSRGSSAQFAGSLDDLLGRGMRGLVLDLRGNLGGSDVDLGEIASMLLPPGLPVAIMRERQGERSELLTSGGARLNASTVVTTLIDQDTGSAGEILAAAFQEHSRGTLVGVRSAGRVGYTRSFELPGGAGIGVTVRTVTTGRDVALEKQGVRPDVVVEWTAGDLDRGIDVQLQRAVQITVQRVGARGLRAAAR